MMAACCPKPVEQLRNIGIINSTTQTHLVGSFYDIFELCVFTETDFLRNSQRVGYSGNYQNLSIINTEPRNGK
jgi:hypothetical protein